MMQWCLGLCGAWRTDARVTITHGVLMLCPDGGCRVPRLLWSQLNTVDLPCLMPSICLTYGDASLSLIYKRSRKPVAQRHVLQMFSMSSDSRSTHQTFDNHCNSTIAIGYAWCELSCKTARFFCYRHFTAACYYNKTRTECYQLNMPPG